jgi:hypothetical protein
MNATWVQMPPVPPAGHLQVWSTSVTGLAQEKSPPRQLGALLVPLDQRRSHLQLYLWDEFPGWRVPHVAALATTVAGTFEILAFLLSRGAAARCLLRRLLPPFRFEVGDAGHIGPDREQGAGELLGGENTHRSVGGDLRLVLSDLQTIARLEVGLDAAFWPRRAVS